MIVYALIIILTGPELYVDTYVFNTKEKCERTRSRINLEVDTVDYFDILKLECRQKVMYSD